MTIETVNDTTVTNVILTAYIECAKTRTVRCYGVDRAGQYYLWITGENGNRSRAIPVDEQVGAPGALVTSV